MYPSIFIWMYLLWAVSPLHAQPPGPQTSGRLDRLEQGRDTSSSSEANSHSSDQGGESDRDSGAATAGSVPTDSEVGDESESEDELEYQDARNGLEDAQPPAAAVAPAPVAPAAAPVPAAPAPRTWADWWRGVEGEAGKGSAYCAFLQAGLSALAVEVGRGLKKDSSTGAQQLPQPRVLYFYPKTVTEACDMLKDWSGVSSEGLAVVSLSAGGIAQYLDGKRNYFKGTGAERSAAALAAGLLNLPAHVCSNLALMAQSAGDDAAVKEWNKWKNGLGSFGWVTGFVLIWWQLHGEHYFHPEVRRRIRPYNEDTQMEAVRRHGGWLAWVISGIAAGYSWKADDPSGTHDDTLGRDGSAAVSSFLQALLAHESPVRLVLALDKRAMGIYEDPGSKIIRCLPEDAPLRVWLSDLRTAYWNAGQGEVQAEYLCLPESRNAIVGLELRREARPDADPMPSVLLLFGRVNLDVPGGFTPQPFNENRRSWVTRVTLFGVLGMPWDSLAGGAEAGEYPQVGNAAELMHQRAQECLGLEDSFVYHPPTHEDAQVLMRGERVLYRSPQNPDAQVLAPDMMVVFLVPPARDER